MLFHRRGLLWLGSAVRYNRLCTLVRTASRGEKKEKKNIIFFLVDFSLFTAEKNLCILHGQVFIIKGHGIHSVCQSVIRKVKYTCILKFYELQK